MPNTFRCTVLCPLCGRDIDGNPVCMLHPRSPDGRVRIWPGDPCQAAEADSEALMGWVRELDFQKNAVIELLEEVTGKSHDWLRSYRWSHWSIWEGGNERETG